MANYDHGDLVRIEGVFTTAAGVALDPTAVICEVIAPGGTKTTYTYGTDLALVKDSTGNYHLDISVAVPGTYKYRWHSTGTGQAAEWQRFKVDTSPFYEEATP